MSVPLRRLVWLAPFVFLVHVAEEATLVHRRYCPGVVTGTLVDLPYGTIVLRSIVRDLRVSAAAVLGAASFGALPMLAHAYLIVFRGSRLF